MTDPLMGKTGFLSQYGGIKPGKLGEVTLEVDGMSQRFLARAASPEADIPDGTQVIVIKTIAERTVQVDVL